MVYFWRENHVHSWEADDNCSNDLVKSPKYSRNVVVVDDCKANQLLQTLEGRCNHFNNIYVGKLGLERVKRFTNYCIGTLYVTWVLVIDSRFIPAALKITFLRHYLHSFIFQFLLILSCVLFISNANVLLQESSI